MDWFFNGVQFCRVNQLGNGAARRDVGHAIQAGHTISLDVTKLNLLIQAINSLPPPSKHWLPVERQIVISCIRSNQWFHGVYDRGNPPAGVERLYEITDAYFALYIPQVSGRQIDPTGGLMIQDLLIANDAPVAASITMNNGVQVWDLSGRNARATNPLRDIERPWNDYAKDLFCNRGAVSPDGKIIVMHEGFRSVIFAVNLNSKKLLWHIDNADHPDWRNNINQSAVAIGNNGRSLFTAGANSIYRWDLAKGEMLAQLSTNQSGVKYMDTSRNGKVLVAGFYDDTFEVWNTDKNEAAGHFVETNATDNCMAISPDGQQIAYISNVSRGKIVLWNWQNGVRRELPLRATSAYSLCWSPNGKCMAAVVDTYPASVLIYDTATWNPIAQWNCGEYGCGPRIAFENNGILLALVCKGGLLGLDINSLKGLGD